MRYDSFMTFFCDVINPSVVMRHDSMNDSYKALLYLSVLHYFLVPDYIYFKATDIGIT